MSAFLVEKATIDRAMWALKYVADISFGEKYETDDLDRIGENMWNLNRKAVAFRYRLEAGESLSYKYGGSLIFSNQTLSHKIACFKAMECLIYQCTGGEQFETDPYFVMLDKAIQKMACAIVHALPEYDSASWG
jgi:hypothetical protein